MRRNQLVDQPQRNRAGPDVNGTATHPGHDPLWTEHDLANGSVVGQRAQDQIGAVSRLRGAVAQLGGRQTLRARPGPIPDPQAESTLGQPLRHGSTHLAQPDECQGPRLPVCRHRNLRLQHASRRDARKAGRPRFRRPRRARLRGGGTGA